MPTCFRQPRTFIVALALTACGVPAESHAAVLGNVPEALEQAFAPHDLPAQPPAECAALHEQIEALDETIEELPAVYALREAYEASDVGRRERAAMEALNAEECFADHDGVITEACAGLMAEVDACATAFESSAAFQEVQALPEVVEFNRLSERFADLCADSLPFMDDGECDWSCDDEECDAPEDDGLPSTV